MPFDDFYNKIVVLSEFNIAKETVDIINANGKFLSDLLKSQLSKGKDGNNEDVKAKYGTFYADFTISNKEKNGKGLGAVTDYVTNFMTGEFYTDIKVHTEDEEFVFDSSTPYFNSIIARSGDVIMELNKENLKIFSEEILIPQLQLRFSTLFNGI